jgi:hypothetical protein
LLRTPAVTTQCDTAAIRGAKPPTDDVGRDVVCASDWAIAVMACAGDPTPYGEFGDSLAAMCSPAVVHCVSQMQNLTHIMNPGEVCFTF